MKSRARLYLNKKYKKRNYEKIAYKFNELSKEYSKKFEEKYGDKNIYITINELTKKIV